MKEEYIQEILAYLNSIDENKVKGLAELSRFVDNNRLVYVITFVNKIFKGD